MNIQPSEIAKVALAIFLSAMVARQGERVRRFTTGFLPPLLIASLTMLLVLLEKDLGTTILLGTLTMTLLFVAGHADRVRAGGGDAGGAADVAADRRRRVSQAGACSTICRASSRIRSSSR
jgi:cell division protein FtsW (lipid II flippase)